MSVVDHESVYENDDVLEKLEQARNGATGSLAASIQSAIDDRKRELRTHEDLHR